LRSAAALRTFSIPSAAGPDAPTVLLLHGIGLSHREFTGLARQLARSRRVVSLDLPGFGGLLRPRHTLSVEAFASIAARHLDRLGSGPVVAVGHSMGAQFAVELARQRPDLVSSLVLIGPVVDSRRRTLLAQAAALIRDSLVEPPKTQLMVTADYLRCGVPWFLAEAVVMRDYPIEVALRGIAAPVLVLRGEHDPIAGADWCERVAGEAPNGRVATVAGARHNAPHSRPAQTAQLITQFLD
jgi:pimeloyl-ACP methyl ester carboxylesterase